MSTLKDFVAIRNAVEGCMSLRGSRHLSGQLKVTNENLEVLLRLQNCGHIESSLKDECSFSHLPDAVGHLIRIVLNPGSLDYFEDIEDLVRYTAEEPPAYYVHGVGEIAKCSSDGNAAHRSIVSYRQMLRARELLRATADFSDSGKATFLTPEKIEIPLQYASSVIPALPHLGDLESQFAPSPSCDRADTDQRLVLFRRGLREHLKAHPPEDRFDLFLRNFETIYDAYSRDYQLWVGNTFGELEKSFEEKRLKFVADLNGILAGVQASILAVPIAAILLGDKFDLANPLKNFLLAMSVLSLGVIALKLLENQEHTLNATRNAILATKDDFEKRHTRRKSEFDTRLRNLDEQEVRVRKLLKSMRVFIIAVAALAFVAWAVSFAIRTNTARQPEAKLESVPSPTNDQQQAPVRPLNSTATAPGSNGMPARIVTNDLAKPKL